MLRTTHFNLKFLGVHFVHATLLLLLCVAFTVANAQEASPPQKAEVPADPVKKVNTRPAQTEALRPEPFDGASIEKMSGQCVTLETELGVIEIEMLAEAAPETVRNFLNLAATGMFNTTTFSRIVKGFVIQGGNLSTSQNITPALAFRSRRTILDEPNAVKHERGIVSMARPDAPNAATSNFFILVDEASQLDGKFAAFGRVMKGMEVVDAINKAPAADEKPEKPVRITRVLVAECAKRKMTRWDMTRLRGFLNTSKRRRRIFAIVCLSTFVAISFHTGCIDKSKVKPSPDTARRELALKSVTFDEKTFIDQASSGEVVNVKLFLAAGINPNAKSEKGDTALIAAAVNNQVNVINALLAGGADITATDKQGLTALMRAARDSRIEAIKALLSRGADVNSMGSVGATALMFTSVRGERKVAETLLDANADVNIRDNVVGTALAWAAYYDRLEIARTLLERGADPNISNDSGGTPLMMASYNGNQEIVRALLDKGADKNAKDKDKMTAEKWALKARHDETAKLVK